jgi:redox-sensitive bicupin YhaK (pirin superfamily)
MVGDGFRVHNFFPSGTDLEMQRMSPFFLLDYNAKWNVLPSNSPRGVGVHPHRGLETVTIAYKGKIAHHDSTGMADIIGEGEVQWMTAGGGILHKEYHEAEFSKKGGIMQMVQLWVNLSAKNKLTPAAYQPITRDKMGKFLLPNQGGTVEVIAGEYSNVKGPAKTFSPIELYNIRLNASGEAIFSLPSGYNTAILVIEGSVTINESQVAPVDHFVLFKNEGEVINIKASEESIVLLLSGEPINEPIAARGPFLMNTMDEIKAAFDDYYNGKFGYLAD